MNKNYEAINLLQPESEHDPFTAERYQQFFKYFPNQTVKVLDIGCNTGRGGKVLKELNTNLQIFGLDAVKDRLNRLPNNIYEEGIHGYSTKIPSEDETFDVVVAGEFIEHIYQSDVDQTLSEIFRVLKIGGRFLLTTPNPTDIKRKWRNESILGGSHVSQHYADMLALKLKMTGFSGIKIKGSGKVTRHLGYHFPLCVYGSYLAMGTKF